MSLQGLEQQASTPLSGGRSFGVVDFLLGRDLAADDHWLVRRLGGPYMRAAVLVLAASFLLPVHGLTASICVFQNMVGHPCPSCGLTRSVTAISHLDFAAAFHYNPFGFIFYTGFVFCAVLSLLPAARRRRLLRPLDGAERLFRPAVLGFFLAMTAFGIWRIAEGVQL